MQTKYKIAAIIGYTSWCGLGCVRGIDSYKYNYNKYDKNAQYMYLNSIGHGMYGTLMYGSIFLFPIFAYKELYRLEANLRNLEKEKETHYYTDLF
jgi:hypothetical protein